MTHRWESITLLVGSLLAATSIYACGAARPASDAGVHDAAPESEAESDASDAEPAADASTEDAADDGGDDTGSTPPPHDAGLQSCASRSDCPGGVCCADLGVGRPVAVCKPESECSGTQICGETSKGTCTSGTCREYECTLGVPARMTLIYACMEPSGEGITCLAAPDGGFPSENDSGM
jgi:hypothetical protein